jgi:hypothetical protein
MIILCDGKQFEIRVLETFSRRRIANNFAHQMKLAVWATTVDCNRQCSRRISTPSDPDLPVLVN